MLIVSGILLVPLYLKSIDNELYGYWIALLALVSIASALESGVSMILTRKLTVAFSSNSLDEARLVFSSALLYSFLCGFLILGYCLLVSANFEVFIGTESLKYNSTLSVIALLSGGSTLLALLGSIYSSVLSAKLDILRPNIYRLIGSIFSLFVTAIFVIVYNRIEGFVFGMLTRELVFLILTKYQSAKILRPSFNRGVVKNVPLLMKELSGQFIGRFSKSYAEKVPVIILAKAFGGSASLMYDLTFKIFIATRQLIQVIITTIFPMITARFIREKNKDEFIDSLDYSVSFLAIVSFGSIYLIFPQLVIFWLGDVKDTIFTGFNLWLVVLISVFTLYFEIQCSNLIAYGQTIKSSRLMIIRGVMSFVFFYGLWSYSYFDSFGEVLIVSALTLMAPLILSDKEKIIKSSKKVVLLALSLGIIYWLNEVLILTGRLVAFASFCMFLSILLYLLWPRIKFTSQFSKVNR